jgi:hypothetical protein
MRRAKIKIQVEKFLKRFNVQYINILNAIRQILTGH